MHTTKRGEFLAIDTIHDSTTNPRRTFDEAKLYELAESIKHNGLIQPLTVRPNNQGFEIVEHKQRMCRHHRHGPKRLDRRAGCCALRRTPVADGS